MSRPSDRVEGPEGTDERPEVRLQPGTTTAYTGTERLGCFGSLLAALGITPARVSRKRPAERSAAEEGPRVIRLGAEGEAGDPGKDAEKTG